jgi:hypothetical protein
VQNSLDEIRIRIRKFFVKMTASGLPQIYVFTPKNKKVLMTNSASK